MTRRGFFELLVLLALGAAPSANASEGFVYRSYKYYLSNAGESCDSCCSREGGRNMHNEAWGSINTDGDCGPVMHFAPSSYTNGSTGCKTMGYFYTHHNQYYCTKNSGTMSCGSIPGQGNDGDTRKLVCACFPADCLLRQWSPWSTCSANCGGGSQTRSRNAQMFAGVGGAPCSTELSGTQTCNTHACPTAAPTTAAPVPTENPTGSPTGSPTLSPTTKTPTTTPTESPTPVDCGSETEIGTCNVLLGCRWSRLMYGRPDEIGSCVSCWQQNETECGGVSGCAWVGEKCIDCEDPRADTSSQEWKNHCLACDATVGTDCYGKHMGIEDCFWFGGKCQPNYCSVMKDSDACLAATNRVGQEGCIWIGSRHEMCIEKVYADAFEAANLRREGEVGPMSDEQFSGEIKEDAGEKSRRRRATVLLEDHSGPETYEMGSPHSDGQKDGDN